MSAPGAREALQPTENVSAPGVGDVARAWLGGRFPLVTELYPVGIAVRAYATRYRLSALPPLARPPAGPALLLNGATVRLAGCILEPGPVHAQDWTMHPPSGWAHTTLFWQALATPPADRLARVRAVDGQGQVWGESLERADSALHFYPMTRWQPGEIVRDDYDVNLNPRTPPGIYRIVVALAGVEGPELECGPLVVD